jgi:hypothetical protein
LLGGVGIEDACLKGDNQLQEHISVYHDHPEPSKYDQGKAKNNYRSSFLSVVPPIQSSSTSHYRAILTSYSLLEPTYSWGHLPITQHGATRLLSALQVFPEIYRYITAFGKKRFPRDEGFGGLDSHVTMNGYGAWREFGITDPLFM